jgi:hypothetical protein
MNGGLQVATGASLGRGAIEISGGEAKPSATLLYQVKKLTLTLKSQY